MRWLAIFLFVFSSVASEAATFQYGTLSSGLRWIGIKGEILEDDDKTFAELAADRPEIAVFLSSPGGLVQAGLSIGDLIYRRRYYTVVPPEAICASVCGAIWLGGAKRYIGEDAKVGFHAAYTSTRGAVEVSSIANAFLGAYFDKIGLKQNAIGYLVSADPRDMTWLTPDDARRNGITYVSVSRSGVTSGGTPIQNADVPPAPTDYHASTPAPAKPALTTDEAESAARLARQFNIRFKQGGMHSVDESINACYQVVLENQKWDSAVYCAALDVLAMIVDGKLSEASKLPPTSRNERPAVIRRVDNIAKTLNFDSGVLRDRGGLVALVAASKVDTTEDPRVIADVKGNRDAVVEHRSSSGSPARARSPASACATFAAQFRQINRGVEAAVGALFCGG